MLKPAKESSSLVVRNGFAVREGGNSSWNRRGVRSLVGEGAVESTSKALASLCLLIGDRSTDSQLLAGVGFFIAIGEGFVDSRASVSASANVFGSLIFFLGVGLGIWLADTVLSVTPNRGVVSTLIDFLARE